MADLIPLLAPVFEALEGLDLTDRAAAERTLASRVSATTMEEVSTALRAAHAAGLLTTKRASPTLTFGRVSKPSPDTRGFAVDAVDIAGPGAVHTHPKGEVSWLLPIEGAPRFEGATEGWVVLPPGSRHVPTVTGGRMLIVYFLPDGAVDWS